MTYEMGPRGINQLRSIQVLGHRIRALREWGTSSSLAKPIS
jgi:hypothetical protein